MKEKSPSEDVNVQLRKKELYKLKLGQAKVAYEKLFAVCQRLRKKVSDLEENYKALQDKYAEVSIRRPEGTKEERTPHKQKSNDTGQGHSTGADGASGPIRNRAGQFLHAKGAEAQLLTALQSHAHQRLEQIGPKHALAGIHQQNIDPGNHAGKI